MQNQTYKLSWCLVNIDSLINSIREKYVSQFEDLFLKGVYQYDSWSANCFTIWLNLELPILPLFGCNGSYWEGKSNLCSEHVSIHKLDVQALWHWHTPQTITISFVNSNIPENVSIRVKRTKTKYFQTKIDPRKITIIACIMRFYLAVPCR